MKASDIFVKSLENEGVEYIFAVPGEENLDLIESLRTSPIKLVVCRHEQAAGFMAATIGRLTGNPGVCLSTVGPGATNLVTASAYALLGAMPMILITGQKPVKASKQGNFQVINTVEMMQPVTKHTQQLVNGNLIPSRIRESFRLAKEERPGPVHIELPEDIAKEEVSTEVFEASYVRRPVAEMKALQKATEYIQQAKFPLLLIGAAANRKSTSKALTLFVEKTGIPFFNTQMGKGVIDEHHPLYLGTAALSEHDYLHCAIDKADLIINVGHDSIEKPPFMMKRNGKQIIHINFFTAKVDDVYFPQLEVIGDIAATICSLNNSVTKQPHWDFSYFMKVNKQINALIDEGSANNGFPMSPQNLVGKIKEVMPKDGIIALDNGMYKIWFARNYLVSERNTLLLDNALATMGAGLPSGIAAKLVHPNKKVVVVTGDGGFMMNEQELETAIRLKLDMLILVLNDNAFGMIKWKQKAEGFGDYGLSYSNPDFVALAQSYGAKGLRVNSSDAFNKIMLEGLETKGVTVIEVPIDYAESDRILTKELREKKCII